MLSSLAVLGFALMIVFNLRLILPVLLDEPPDCLIYLCEDSRFDVRRVLIRAAKAGQHPMMTAMDSSITLHSVSHFGSGVLAWPLSLMPIWTTRKGAKAMHIRPEAKRAQMATL